MLHPEVHRRMLAMLADVRRRGITIRVTSTYRSSAKQAQLYDAWLRRGRKGLPAARPGLSTHEYGFAFDAVWDPRHDATVSQVAAQHGLRWFGPKDRVHFDPWGPAQWNAMLREVGLL